MFCRYAGCLALLCAAAAAQTPPAAFAPEQDLHQLAVEAAAAEVHDLEPYNVYFRYRMHSVDAKGDLTRDLIESRDGSVARLISKEGRALTAEEDEAERERLQAMIDDPSAFAKHVKTEQTGKKQAIDIIRLIPDAMLFSYTEGQPQAARADQAQGQRKPDIVIDFHPKPGWSPPTLASETLTGLQGRIWIDAQTHHMTRLETNVFRPVNLGFGVVAKLFPGGNVTLTQSQIASQRWLTGHFVEHISLRVAMVKTIRENSDVQTSNYASIDSMSYQQAVQLLLATPLPR